MLSEINKGVIEYKMIKKYIRFTQESVARIEPLILFWQ